MGWSTTSTPALDLFRKEGHLNLTVAYKIGDEYAVGGTPTETLELEDLHKRFSRRRMKA